VATFLCIGTTASRKTGSSNKTTEIRTAISFARRRMRDFEKRKSSSLGLEWCLGWRWRQDCGGVRREGFFVCVCVWKERGEGFD